MMALVARHLFVSGKMETSNWASSAARQDRYAKGLTPAGAGAGKFSDYQQAQTTTREKFT
jgi:hypothetical protein